MAEKMSAMVDYTDAFPDSLAAQGKGNNFLAVFKMDCPTKDRFDGKRVSFRVVYRWLSCSCETSGDEAFACTQGSETTFWQRKELKEGFFDRLKAGTINLFDEFNLF